jgi:hypothetical protein
METHSHSILVPSLPPKTLRASIALEMVAGMSKSLFVHAWVTPPSHVSFSLGAPLCKKISFFSTHRLFACLFVPRNIFINPPKRGHPVGAQYNVQLGGCLSALHLSDLHRDPVSSHRFAHILLWQSQSMRSSPTLLGCEVPSPSQTCFSAVPTQAAIYGVSPSSTLPPSRSPACVWHERAIVYTSVRQHKERLRLPQTPIPYDGGYPHIDVFHRPPLKYACCLFISAAIHVMGVAGHSES